MAIVTHKIHGIEYLYDHHKVGGRVVSTYLGRKDDIRTQQKIPATGYPITAKDYPEAHRNTDIQEKSEYGSDRFKALESHADATPEGELIGSHDGKRKVSKRVPEKFKGQVLRHEFIEQQKMEGT